METPHFALKAGSNTQHIMTYCKKAVLNPQVRDTQQGEDGAKKRAEERL